ncbi:hypothetical protein M4951_05250 [Blastopirellula sp. J2-11]|uniref:hypothetical protein n=1 Tax=Blastopirellula sp. J2-11 TaxID=2943192 RepID=UPI0021CA71ED|nr:hypothetical protein [Blastopirellula sp. J2-11]UUO07716.1 hypothetical protein M4951_05250 [Blastopirellula sp. J2-11]
MISSFRIRATIHLPLLFAASMLIGCNTSSTGLEKAQVRGNVTLDGQPLSNVSIRFFSSEGSGGGFPLSADGSFQSNQPIKLGVYSIALVSLSTPPGAAPPSEGLLGKVPLHFWSVRSSELQAEVTADGANTFQFNLSSKERPPTGFRPPRTNARGAGPVLPEPPAS